VFILINFYGTKLRRFGGQPLVRFKQMIAKFKQSLFTGKIPAFTVPELSVVQFVSLLNVTIATLRLLIEEINCL